MTRIQNRTGSGIPHFLASGHEMMDFLIKFFGLCDKKWWIFSTQIFGLFDKNFGTFWEPIFNFFGNKCSNFYPLFGLVSGSAFDFWRHFLSLYSLRIDSLPNVNILSRWPDLGLSIEGGGSQIGLGSRYLLIQGMVYAVLAVPSPQGLTIDLLMEISRWKLPEISAWKGDRNFLDISLFGNSS